MEQSEFVLQLRMLATLAFLPSQNIGQVLAAICDRIRRNFGDVTEEMLVYFEGTYIGSFCVDAPRGDPLFSMELRNMFHRTDAEFQRTNNRVEGWQRSFQGHLHHAILVFESFYRC